MLFSEPKIPQNGHHSIWHAAGAEVSVLFSEPKIPQIVFGRAPADGLSGFSALQRAENSSKHRNRRGGRRFRCFSALQRAENSSNTARAAAGRITCWFQCSSASRKFLKLARMLVEAALVHVSVLFSEPKIPQTETAAQRRRERRRFSALQRAENSSKRFVQAAIEALTSFSALQRAENSSNATLAPASIHIPDCDDHASSFLSLPGASP